VRHDLLGSAEINACSDSRDWERLKEIRESIATRASIYIPPALVSQTQAQAQAQAQSQSQPHSQPRIGTQTLSQPSYYQPARSQEASNYAMAYAQPSSYGALNGLRAQNLPANGYQAGQIGLTARSRSSGGLNPPAFSYKPSPFYEPKYQLGDVKTLEGASGAVLFPLAHVAS
jgi:E3 SUMO-protein ligase PIAS1